VNNVRCEHYNKAIIKDDVSDRLVCYMALIITWDILKKIKIKIVVVVFVPGNF